MKTFDSIALGRPHVLLPGPGVDLEKWAVIACDQFTSEPEYWDRVSAAVGDAPSTLNLIYPEVHLGEAETESRIARIRGYMTDYLSRGLFEEREGFIYVERQTGRHIRKGLVVCIDLEGYDFRKGASSLIRATEGTILERIPPRVKIRKGAPLELPHIMVLIDDPAHTVLGPLSREKGRLSKQYDFELMMDSGRLSGYSVDDPDLEAGILSSLEAMTSPDVFAAKYGLSRDVPVLLYAMGDGNHSLATAKTIWEQTKASAGDKTVDMSSPLRYALVELVNLHDEALDFEPIHRTLFDVDPGQDPAAALMHFYSGRSRLIRMGSATEMTAEVDLQTGNPHKVGLITAGGFAVIEVDSPESNLPVGTLQSFLDRFMEEKGARKIDYVHGTDAVVKLGGTSAAAGFYLPAMNKHDLFKTVILDGALPRKTFSMGEAWEKRFYMEARRLS